MMLVMATGAVLGCTLGFGKGSDTGAKSALDRLVGQPADIAPSAYQYRADRKAEANPPESWLALIHFAHMPLNKPVDSDAPAIESVLCSLLWEEIRPIRRLELSWPTSARRRPQAKDLTISTLMNNGASSSWWNNLNAVTQSVKPAVSNGGRTYVYVIPHDTCGIVVSLAGALKASGYDVPSMRALVEDAWKKMDVEIEWGFEPAAADKDYGGKIETYDGHVSALNALSVDANTMATGKMNWRSSGKSKARRGIRFSLLYVGTSKWRKVQPFTTQPDDVARTIVTLWTRAGNFSFLAADLENGPIYAPEYGFFVRRTSPLAPASVEAANAVRAAHIPLSAKMNNIAGESRLLGWGNDLTPWFGGNPTEGALAPLGVALPPKSVAMHPGSDLNVAVGWCSPIKGTVQIKARLAHAQSGSNGIEWFIAHESKTGRKNLVQGATDGNDSPIPFESVKVEPGDMISLVVGPKGDHRCDTNSVELTVSEVAKGSKPRIWDLTQDVVGSIHAGNPHADSQGNADVWHFYCESPAATLRAVRSEPPIALASKAASAKEFLSELKKRNLKTIREKIRAHPEQTWEGAVTAYRGKNLPPHPMPPAGSEPIMQVQVPSERMTDQWNLGAWHLVRHCEKNPVTGKRWFNDFPYGILGAETYMILHALDLTGSNDAAQDGFDQWTLLPMDPNSKGHHEWALPDRPNGLFSEGHGCLTHAVGPPGYGGQMDGVHAFGPGSIGWALTEHYWLTGDKAWLKAVAPRIRANADWMLRQRKLVSSMLPGGERLWCKGLQPALQVTPDSGGLWMQFYECEAYYWASVSRLAATLAEIDPIEGAKLNAEADAYRKDLRAAVERSIALSPVVPVRDGTFHSVVPFACYVRGLGTGAWGWQRDGSGSHVGPLYWETVQSAAALISPAGLLPATDVRVQGYLDILEDRLLLENQYVGARNWFDAGWQYQGGLERTPNMHLAGDDVPVFLRSFYNCYAVDILPNDGYTFNEHAVHGPPDKIFEEAAFLERFRNLLVMEEGDNLWLCRAAPRAWLEHGKTISVKNAPTHFGTVGYEVTSNVDHGIIAAVVDLPSRGKPNQVLLRLRHPIAVRMKSVWVDGKPWRDFDPARELVKLHGLRGRAAIEVKYEVPVGRSL